MSIAFPFSGNELLDSIYTERNIFSTKHPSLQGSSMPGSLVNSVLKGVRDYKRSKDTVFAITQCGRAIAITMATDLSVDTENAYIGRPILEKLSILHKEADAIIDKHFKNRLVAKYNLIPTKLPENPRESGPIAVKEGAELLLSSMVEFDAENIDSEAARKSRYIIGQAALHGAITPIVLICPVNNMGDLISPDELNTEVPHNDSHLNILRKAVLNSPHTLAGGLSKILVEALSAYVRSDCDFVLKSRIDDGANPLNRCLIVRNDLIKSYLHEKEIAVDGTLCGFAEYASKKYSGIESPIEPDKFRASKNKTVESMRLVSNKFDENSMARTILSDCGTHIRAVISLEGIKINNHDVMSELTLVDTPKRILNTRGLCENCLYKVCCLIDNIDDLTPADASVCRLLAVDSAIKEVENKIKRPLRKNKKTVLGYFSQGKLVLTRRFFSTIYNYSQGHGGLSPEEWIDQAQKHNTLDITTKEAGTYNGGWRGSSKLVVTSMIDKLCSSEFADSLSRKFTPSSTSAGEDLPWLVVTSDRGDGAIDSTYNKDAQPARKIKKQVMRPVRRSNNSLADETHAVIVVSPCSGDTVMSPENILSRISEGLAQSAAFFTFRNVAESLRDKVHEKTIEITKYLLSDMSRLVMEDASGISNLSVVEEYGRCEDITRALTSTGQYIEYNPKILLGGLPEYAPVLRTLVSLALLHNQSIPIHDSNTDTAQPFFNMIGELRKMPWFNSTVGNLRTVLSPETDKLLPRQSMEGECIKENYKQACLYTASTILPENITKGIYSTLRIANNRFMEGLLLDRSFLVTTEYYYWFSVRLSEKLWNSTNATNTASAMERSRAYNDIYSRVAYERIAKLGFPELETEGEDDAPNYTNIMREFGEKLVDPNNYGNVYTEVAAHCARGRDVSLDEYRRLVIEMALVKSLPCGTNDDLVKNLRRLTTKVNSNQSVQYEDSYLGKSLQGDLLEDSATAELTEGSTFSELTYAQERYRSSVSTSLPLAVDIVHRKWGCTLRAGIGWTRSPKLVTETKSLTQNVKDHLAQDSVATNLHINSAEYIRDEAMLRDIENRIFSKTGSISLCEIDKPAYWTQLPTNEAIQKLEVTGPEYWVGHEEISLSSAKENAIGKKISNKKITLLQSIKQKSKIRIVGGVSPNHESEKMGNTSLPVEEYAPSLLEATNITQQDPEIDTQYYVGDLLIANCPSGSRPFVNVKKIELGSAVPDMLLESLDRNQDGNRLLHANRLHLDYTEVLDQRILQDRSMLSKEDMRRGISSRGPAVMGLRPKVALTNTWQAVDTKDEKQTSREDVGLDWRDVNRKIIVEDLIKHKLVITDLIKENNLVLYPNLDMDITTVDTDTTSKVLRRKNRRLQLRQLLVNNPLAKIDTPVRKIVASKFARRYAYGNGFMHKLPGKVNASNISDDGSMIGLYTFLSGETEVVALRLDELQDLDRHVPLWTNQIGILKDIILENINKDIQTIEYRLDGNLDIYQQLISSYNRSGGANTEPWGSIPSIYSKRDDGPELVSSKFVIKKTGDGYAVTLHDGTEKFVHTQPQLTKLVRASLMEQMYFIYRQLYSINSSFTKGLFVKTLWPGEVLTKLGENAAYSLITKTLVPSSHRRKRDVSVGESCCGYGERESYCKTVGGELLRSDEAGVLSEDRAGYSYTETDNDSTSPGGISVKESHPSNKYERRAQKVTQIAHINNAVENRTCYLPIVSPIMESIAIVRGIKDRTIYNASMYSKGTQVIEKKKAEVMETEELLAQLVNYTPPSDLSSLFSGPADVIERLIVTELAYRNVLYAIDAQGYYLEIGELDKESAIRSLELYSDWRIIENGAVAAMTTLNDQQQTWKVLSYLRSKMINQPKITDTNQGAPDETFITSRREMAVRVATRIVDQRIAKILSKPSSDTIEIWEVFLPNYEEKAEALLEKANLDSDNPVEWRDARIQDVAQLILYAAWRVSSIIKHGMLMMQEEQQESMSAALVYFCESARGVPNQCANNHTTKILQELDKKYLEYSGGIPKEKASLMGEISKLDF